MREGHGLVVRSPGTSPRNPSSELLLGRSLRHPRVYSKAQHGDSGPGDERVPRGRLQEDVVMRQDRLTTSVRLTLTKIPQMVAHS